MLRFILRSILVHSFIFLSAFIVFVSCSDKYCSGEWLVWDGVAALFACGNIVLLCVVSRYECALITISTGLIVIMSFAGALWIEASSCKNVSFAQYMLVCVFMAQSCLGVCGIVLVYILSCPCRPRVRSVSFDSVSIVSLE